MWCATTALHSCFVSHPVPLGTLVGTMPLVYQPCLQCGRHIVLPVNSPSLPIQCIETHAQLGGRPLLAIRVLPPYSRLAEHRGVLGAPVYSHEARLRMGSPNQLPDANLP